MRKANLIAARTLVLAQFAEALGAFTLLEQPRHCSGSAMERLPQFQTYISRRKTYKMTICQGAFGAGTAKPTWLYANHTKFKWMASVLMTDTDKSRVADTPPIMKVTTDVPCQYVCTFLPNLRTQCVDAIHCSFKDMGRSRVTGVPDRLKATQLHPQTTLCWPCSVQQATWSVSICACCFSVDVQCYA